jgi:hypothetical protein
VRARKCERHTHEHRAPSNDQDERLR